MDLRAAAEYFVLFRLAQLGYDAALASNAHADVVACSPGATRVALLRIYCWSGDSWSTGAPAGTADARNHVHVFVDFGPAGSEPACFVVPARTVSTQPRGARSWPRTADLHALEKYREAWHLLGLTEKSSFRSTPVESPSSPSA